MVGETGVRKAGPYAYEVSGILFDVRELARRVPRFEAGTTVEEHKSLMVMAELHEGLEHAVEEMANGNVHDPDRNAGRRVYEGNGS